MKFHEILRQRRLALGLTQEQLAQRLGVSAPAVNKWERNNSYPDITLLPPLARLLEVDLNTLLSFQEELTEEEIGAFANVLGERAQQEGCEAAFRLARDKLREFPNSDLLAYSLAGLLEGLVLMSPDAGEQGDRDTWTEEIDALYERGRPVPTPRYASGPAPLWPGNVSAVGIWTGPSPCWHSCPTRIGKSGPSPPPCGKRKAGPARRGSFWSGN